MEKSILLDVKLACPKKINNSKEFEEEYFDFYIEQGKIIQNKPIRNCYDLIRIGLKPNENTLRNLAGLILHLERRYSLSLQLNLADFFDATNPDYIDIFHYNLNEQRMMDFSLLFD